MDIAIFITHFEQAIDGIAPGSITAETVFKELPQWDSLALLLCVSMMESEYGVRIAGRNVSDCQTVADLCNLIGIKKSSSSSIPD